jgi:hypothetical protein
LLLCIFRFCIPCDVNNIRRRMLCVHIVRPHERHMGGHNYTVRPTCASHKMCRCLEQDEYIVFLYFRLLE